MKKRGILFLFVFIIFIIDVYAIGISPSRTELSFEPNQEIDCSYLLLNNVKEGIGSNLNVFVYTVGDLNKSIEIEEENVILPPNQWIPFSCKMTLPPSLGPGLHENGVVATETDSKGGMVGALAGVMMQIWIRVPYPGKYLEGILKVNDIAINEEANFDINLISRGEEDINDVKVYIDIYDSLNNKIATIESENFGIKSYESKDVSIRWNSRGNSADIYSVIARVYYDNNFLELKDNFRIGDLYIEIVNVSIDNIKRNNIGKFNIEIQSMWNSEIKDVYATVKIIYNNQEINSINTESINVEPWSKKTMVAYWDSKDADVGDYKGKVIVNYEGKTNEKTIEFKVVELSIFDKLKVSLVYIVVIIVLLLLILINIIINIHYKRKDEKKKEKK